MFRSIIQATVRASPFARVATRAFAPPAPCYVYKRLLHDTITRDEVIAVCRDYGSDLLWPRSLKDDEFTGNIARIATFVAVARRWPLFLVHQIMNEICWSRASSLSIWKEEDRLSELGMPLSQNDTSLSGVPKALRSYATALKEWKFKGSVVARLSKDDPNNWYSKFLQLAMEMSPEGYGANKGPLGDRTYVMIWTVDGHMWSTLINKRELDQLNRFCSEIMDGGDFTLLFIEHRLIKPPSTGGMGSS